MTEINQPRPLLLRPAHGKCARFVFALCLLLGVSGRASDIPPRTFRVYTGITLYIVNPTGKSFEVSLDIRDINFYANGPRELLLKIYRPDGSLETREIIPDDGIVSGLYQERIGGWDHELMSRVNLLAKGADPFIAFSAFSDPARLASIQPRSIRKRIEGGPPGVYRMVLLGFPDHYVSIGIEPKLAYGISGHPSFACGTGDHLQKSYVHVPEGTQGLFFIFIEPDLPATRRFTLKTAEGETLIEATASGAYYNPVGSYNLKNPAWEAVQERFKNGKLGGKTLRFDVSPSRNDFLVQLTFQQPRTGAFKDYVGMGSQAIFCPDPATAEAIRGGTTVVDGEVFWHPFQIRFHEWLKRNPLNGNDAEIALRKELEALHQAFRLIETGDGRGSASWNNWAYSFGYYGCKIWRDSWIALRNPELPEACQAIIREGLIMAGDRLAFAAGMERVNGNAFAQIPPQLWYCKEATGDPIHARLFETFWERWSQGEGWGKGAGLSRSGDAQEHFAHDGHYGSYLLDNWQGGTWVKNGIIGDADGKDDRFQKVLDRYQELYSFLYCPTIAANPWSSRTVAGPHQADKNWSGTHPWKGMPGEDFTVSVNGGDEWFAARRKTYYFLSFHGRLAPEWMCRTFEGQLGFGGGIICQLTIPGKGTVLASTLADSYGKGMAPENWRNFHLHSVVGERWDGAPFVAAISDHENTARLDENTVSSTGEIRDGHAKVSRTYTFLPDRIRCAVSLAESDYRDAMTIWSDPGKKWGQIKRAYEMIPFVRPKKGTPFSTTATRPDGSSGQLTVEPMQARTIRIDHGDFGVEIVLPSAKPVMLGANDTVMIGITEEETSPGRVQLEYELVPYARP